MKCYLTIFSVRNLLILIVGLTTYQSHAVAYCALRDPVNTIYQLFPSADNYRSFVSTVGRDVRAAVERELPFRLHFNELGRHTLYLAQKGEQALGYVHARSERGRWGLNEYVWAISTDLRIRSGIIQRSRDPIIRKADVKTLVEPFVGKNLQELASAYTSNAYRKEGSLREELLRSAIKTLFVTKHAWAKELKAIDALSIALKVDLNSSRVILVENLFGEVTNAQLSKLELAQSPVFDRSAMTAFRMLDDQGAFLGLIVHTPFTLRDPENPLWWVANSIGEIKFVGDVNHQNTEYSYVLDYAPLHPRDCSSAIDLAALEIGVLARNQY